MKCTFKGRTKHNQFIMAFARREVKLVKSLDLFQVAIHPDHP